MKNNYNILNIAGFSLSVVELFIKIRRPLFVIYMLASLLTCLYVQDFWFFIATILLFLVVDLVGKNIQLSAATNKDLLTGLGNKYSLNASLEREASRVNRQGGFLVFIFIDIDNFKRINDTCGHKTGDAVLVEVARRLQEQKRRYDALIRYGGDEFCVICSQVQGGGDAVRIRVKLNDLLHFCYREGNNDVLVQASSGMAIYPTDTEDLQQLVALADYRMYEQKEQRKLLRMAAL
jgi:diguanylate cyclase (GGDEF)-like protein